MRQIQQILQSLGYDFFDFSHYEQVALWKNWYTGNVGGFHSYDFFNGEKRIKDRRTSLNMASTVCQGWADLLMNEKTIIRIGDEAAQKFVKEVFLENNFYELANQLIEKTFALGQGAFVCYIENGKVKINYITADMIFPLSFENGKIISCAFVSSKKEFDKRKISFNIHAFDGQGYTISNLFYEEKEKKGFGKEEFFRIENPAEIPEVVGRIKRPLFVTVRPNIANPYDLNSPFGVSVYANAIDALKSCDYAYDAFNVALRLSRPRIAVTDEAVSFGSDGSPAFDDQDTVFYKMAGTLTGAEKIIRDISIKPQTDQFSKAIQTSLNLLSQKVGFGKNMYRWDSTGLKTATEVISQNDEMYRTLKKHEILLKRALQQLASVILYLGKEKLNKKFDERAEISVSFDDSLIENNDAMISHAMAELQNGIIDREEYFKRVYKMSEEEAEKLSLAIKKRSPDLK